MSATRAEGPKDADPVGVVAVAPDPESRALLKPDRLSPSRRRDAFLAELEQMSEEERVRAARFGAFSRWERSVWAASYPEQVPLINGELEWIALGLADLD